MPTDFLPTIARVVRASETERDFIGTRFELRRQLAADVRVSNCRRIQSALGEEQAASEREGSRILRARVSNFDLAPVCANVINKLCSLTLFGNWYIKGRESERTRGYPSAGRDPARTNEPGEAESHVYTAASNNFCPDWRQLDR